MSGYTYGGTTGATYNSTTGGTYSGTTTATTELRATRTGVTDTDLIATTVTDAFSRFASSATITFIDPNGTKNNTWNYGLPINIDVSEDGGRNFSTLFAGMVGDANRTTRTGSPKLEVEAVENSHFLRRNQPDKTYTTTTITNILKDLVETFTPVTWNASNVDVVNDSSITREFKGERVDEAIAYLSSESANEEWGVNDSFEFFFREQTVDRAEPITDADVIDYDLPEEGKRAINQFTLYYDSGGSEKAIVVKDREEQQRLEDELGTDRPVVIAGSDTRPEITSEDRAETVARQQLKRKSVVQTGTVTVPLGRFNTNSGDVLSLTISDAGISGVDFRVAQVEWRWGEGIAVFSVAENSASNIESLLVGLSDNVQNDRFRDADTTVTPTEFLDLSGGVELTVTTSLTTKTANSASALYNQATYNQDTYNGGTDTTASVTVDSKKATKALLNLLRDLWADGNSAFIDLTHLAVGTNDTAATSADSSLEAEVGRVSIQKFGSGDAVEKVEFLATVPAGGSIAEASDLEEFSITDASTGGNHYLRATMPATAIDASTRLKIRVQIEADTNSDLQGVITSKGQERLIDLLIGESGHEPTDAVYGTGTTAATESDTALGSKQHEDTIDNFTDREPGVTEIVERITAGDANTTNFSEAGHENSGDELLRRVVFDAFDSDVVVEWTDRFVVTNA